MTKLTYVLYDGTVTPSYSIALASGKPFTRRFESVKEAIVDEERKAKILKRYFNIEAKAQ